VNKNTLANTPQEGGSDPIAKTGAGCGFVKILVLLWLGFSAYMAYEANLANPIHGTRNGGSFVLWFVYWSLCDLIFLIPALLLGWSHLSAVSRRKSDVLAGKAPVKIIWKDVWRLLLLLSAGIWSVISLILGDPLWVWNSMR